MGRRGRPPLITHEEKISVLEKHAIFNETGYLKKENNAVWTEVRDNINQNHDKCQPIK